MQWMLAGSRNMLNRLACQPQGLRATGHRHPIRQKGSTIPHRVGHIRRRQQNGLRSGMQPVPLCEGMAVAVEIVRIEGVTERQRDSDQWNLIVNGLQDRCFEVNINGTRWVWRLPGNANLRFEGFAAQDIFGAAQARFAASTRAVCTSGIPEAVL